MEYYHVYIDYKDQYSDCKRSRLLAYGYTKEEILEEIAKPYNENKPLHSDGVIHVHPSQIREIYIFASTVSSGKEIILPNGKNAFEEDDFEYKIDCFLKGKIPTILGLASDKFLFASDVKVGSSQGVSKQT